MNLPTPTNPIVLTFRGHTPALKNNKQPVIRNGRIVPMTNPGVKKWMRIAGDDAALQWQRQQDRLGFGTILMPHRVFVFVSVVFYATTVDTIAKSDSDNAYSTIQEMLQMPGQPGGVIGVFEDDRQVFRHVVDKEVTRHRKTQHANAYIWVVDTRPLIDQQKEFEENREAITKNAFEFGSELPELFDNL